MLASIGCKTKKDLKARIGKTFQYQETSIHNSEFKFNSPLTVVGPSAYDRRWYAIVTVNEQRQVTSVK